MTEIARASRRLRVGRFGYHARVEPSLAEQVMKLALKHQDQESIFLVCGDSSRPANSRQMRSCVTPPSDFRGKMRHLKDLPNLDHVTVLSRAALHPIDVPSPLLAERPQLIKR